MRKHKDIGRTEFYRLRLLPEEKADYTEAAKCAGAEVADWVRIELNRAAADWINGKRRKTTQEQTS